MFVTRFDPSPGVSGQEMCETIAAYWREAGVRDVTPEAIWNYSPTGELMEVFWWYEEARVWNALRDLDREFVGINARAFSEISGDATPGEIQAVHDRLAGEHKARVEAIIGRKLP